MKIDLLEFIDHNRVDPSKTVFHSYYYCVSTCHFISYRFVHIFLHKGTFNFISAIIDNMHNLHTILNAFKRQKTLISVCTIMQV